MLTSVYGTILAHQSQWRVELDVGLFGKWQIQVHREGDGDNTLIGRAKNQLGVFFFLQRSLIKIIVSKYSDIVKTFYNLRNQKVKISNQLISHLTKCLKYVFSKTQKTIQNMRANLIQQQFLTKVVTIPSVMLCFVTNDETYVHRSMPYKVPVRYPLLYPKRTEVFVPVIGKAANSWLYTSTRGC